MNAIDAYFMYFGIKKYFSDGYDYFKYKGKTKNKKIKENILFLSNKLLKKHSDLETFLVSNFIVDDYFIYSLVHEQECILNYKKYITNQESFSYNLRKKLDDMNIESLFDLLTLINCSENEHPKLITHHMSGHLSIQECLAIMQFLSHEKIIAEWKKRIYLDPIFNDQIIKLNRYKPFFEKKFKKDYVNGVFSTLFT